MRLPWLAFSLAAVFLGRALLALGLSAQLEQITTAIQEAPAETLERVLRDNPPTFSKWPDTPVALFDVIDRSWRLRTTLHQRIESVHSVSLDLHRLSERISRHLRTLEEQIGEKLGVPPSLPLRGSSPSFLTNVEEYVPEAGDIILTRSEISSHATLARLGIHGQFSHVAMVDVDDNGVPWTIEANMESGVDSFSWPHFLKRKVRLLVLKYADQKIAARGARIVRELALKAKAAGKPLRYNFSLEENRDDSFYCSQVIRLALRLGGATRVLPEFLTSLKNIDAELLRGMTIKPTEFIAPIDFEMDPDLRIACEWRDLSKTRRLRRIDAALEAIYELMSEQKYSFDPRFGDRALATILKVARAFPFAGAALRRRLPSYIPYKLLSFVFALNRVALETERYLVHQDMVFEERTSQSMPFSDLIREAREYLKRTDSRSQLRFHNCREELLGFWTEE